MIMINFKTYEESTGKNAIKLAKAAEKIAKETGQKIIVIPPLLDLKEVAKKVNIDVYAQHVDEKDYGANTGSILIEAAKQVGAKGSIINHSENRIPIEKIQKIVEKAKQQQFTIVVCVQDIEEAKKVDAFKPDYIAYEPPELIGGNVSVSTARPEVIKDIVQSVSTSVIVGAGVKNKEDVKKSIELGAKGVLVASGVVKSKRQKKAIKELVEGLK
ncbi:MAG: triose-phosphate isomerase [Candidatus Nanoarchaeia archaeon]